VAQERVLQELLGLIDIHGWAVRLVAPAVGEEGFPFAYTVGIGWDDA
jgi:hypothetical protein